MIATKHYDLFWSCKLHADQEQENFDWEVTSVDIITKKNVFSCLAVAAYISLEKF